MRVIPMVRNHHTNGQRIRVIKKNSEFRQRISIKLSYTEPSENCLSELSQKNARLMTSAAGKPEEKPEDVVDWGDDDSGTNSLTVPSKTASPMTVSSKAYYDQDERGNSLPTASYKNLRRDFQDTSKELLREIFEKPNLLSKLGLVKTDDSVDTLLLVSGQEVRIQIQVIGMLNTGETNTNTTYPDNRDTPSEMSWEPTYRGVSNRPCKFINTAKGFAAKSAQRALIAPSNTTTTGDTGTMAWVDHTEGFLHMPEDHITLQDHTSCSTGRGCCGFASLSTFSEDDGQ
jgi:hypothetical protein